MISKITLISKTLTILGNTAKLINISRHQNRGQHRSFNAIVMIRIYTDIFMLL